MFITLWILRPLLLDMMPGWKYHFGEPGIVTKGGLGVYGTGYFRDRVGIQEPDPQASLDVRGTLRVQTALMHVLLGALIHQQNIIEKQNRRIDNLSDIFTNKNN